MQPPPPFSVNTAFKWLLIASGFHALGTLFPDLFCSISWFFPMMNSAYTSLENNSDRDQRFNMAYPFSQDHAAMVYDNSQFNTEWDPDLDPNDLRELQDAEQDPTKIISELPKEAARMGYYSTICLIFNRMIGMLWTISRAKPKLIKSFCRCRHFQFCFGCVSKYTKHRAIPNTLDAWRYCNSGRLFCFCRAGSFHPEMAAWTNWGENIRYPKWRWIELRKH
jgi:hypothetical protein